MKTHIISDTHGSHSFLDLPGGDLLIHCGDWSLRGDKPDAENFLSWFDEQSYAHKVFIAGNHDGFAENCPKEFKELIPSGIHYLENSGIKIENKKIWGSPYTPMFNNWHFMEVGEDIKQHWDQIPYDTDVLVTHGPPFGILDLAPMSSNVGCPHLRVIVERVKPELHCFGHIHLSHGKRHFNGTDFINAAIMTEQYRPYQDYHEYVFKH